MTIYVLLMVPEPRLNTLRALMTHHRCKTNKTTADWNEVYVTERYEFKLKTSACSRAIQVSQGLHLSWQHGSRTPRRGTGINHMGHKFIIREGRR